METRWLVATLTAAMWMGSSVRAEAQADALGQPSPASAAAEAPVQPSGADAPSARPSGATAPPVLPGHELETKTPFSARLPRLGLTTLVGGAVSVGAGFGFFELGCALGGGRDPSGFGDDHGCGIYGMILGAVGVGVLTPLSVLATGWLMDGNGSAMWTAIGTVIGAALGQIGAFAMSTRGLAEEQVIPMLIGPALGAVIFYELWSDPSRAEVEAALDGGIEWHTSVSPRDGGGTVGVTGTF